MQFESMFDISYGFDENATVRLEQQNYAGEVSTILLAPEQLKPITRCLCGPVNFTEDAATRCEELKRRLRVLTDKLVDIVGAECFRRDLLDQGEDGCWYLARLDGLVDIASEFSDKPLTSDDDEDTTEPAQSLPAAIQDNHEHHSDK